VAPTPAPSQPTVFHFFSTFLQISRGFATVVFFLMALFRPLRSLVLDGISRGSISSLLFTSRTVGAYFIERLPLVSGIVKMVYNLVGIWPILFVCWIVLRRFGELFSLFWISMEELWLKMPELFDLVFGLQRYIARKFP